MLQEQRQHFEVAISCLKSKVGHLPRKEGCRVHAHPMRPSGSKVYRVHHLRCGKQTETTCAAQPERSKDTSVALPAFCAESFSTSTCGRFGKEKFDSKSPVQKDQNKKHLGGWIENDKNDSKRIWIYKYIIYMYTYISSCLSRSCFLMARIRKVPLKHPTHIQHYLLNYRLLTCASSNAP